MAKIIFMLYNSIVLALLLACLSFNNVWLEMRINIGWLIPPYVLILCFGFGLVLRKSPGINRNHKWFTLINILVSSAVSALILGIDSVKVVPAAIIREGLNLNTLSFGSLNIALGIFLMLGLIIILVQKVDQDVDYEK